MTQLGTDEDIQKIASARRCRRLMLPLNEAEAFLNTDVGNKFSRVWMSVIDRAMNDLDTGIQLMIFDNRDVIMKEISAAIATVK